MLTALARRTVQSVIQTPSRSGSIMPKAPGGNWRSPLFPQDITPVHGNQAKPAPYAGPAEITEKLNHYIAPKWEFYAYASALFACGVWVGWRADAELAVVLGLKKPGQH
jgi:hypothetical protein